MKFRLKITFCMIVLVSLLFGFGSSALISTSFQHSLEREKKMAQESYQIMLNTLQVVNQADSWNNTTDVVLVLEQLSKQDVQSWEALSLSTTQETLYQQGNATIKFLDLSGKSNANHCTISSFTNTSGAHFLQLSGTILLGAEELRLDAAYDISSLYTTRAQQLKLYSYIFSILIFVCAALAYLLSIVLTRPLSRLSNATREIAAENYAYRSQIHTHDEIGAVSRDFDRMAETLQKNVAEMEASLERQNEFIGNFTHEIKTPMTSIIGYSDLLRTQVLTPDEQADAANYIFSEARRLEHLSLKMLNLFVVDNDALTFRSVSPSALVNRVVSFLQPAYAKQQITFITHCSEGTCYLEPDLIYSLLENIIDNARKAFDHGGTIEISVEVNDMGCLLTIQDNGRGIPQDSLQHLTEAFYRVDKSRARSLGGAGLGLTLCHRIVELHHGTLSFSSTVNEGTLVTIFLKGDQE